MADDDGDKPIRDARGRWLKGHCPNPNGRPRKIHERGPGELVDIGMFANSMIDLNVSGRKVRMTRREAIFHMMFQKALAGSVTQQYRLHNLFAASTEKYAEVQTTYWELVFNWVEDNPEYKKRGPESIPAQVRHAIAHMEQSMPRIYPEFEHADLTYHLFRKDFLDIETELRVHNYEDPEDDTDDEGE